MDSLINLIKTEHGNPKTVFVFPSEAAAEYWRKESLAILSVRAVRNDRFVSWDSFKESITSHDRRERPVNSVLRRLFAADIVRKNSSGSPLFTRIIPAEYSGQSGVFSETILRILPELKAFVERLKDCEFDSELVRDYSLLYGAYKDFLSRNGFFEPSWDFPELKNLGRDYLIVFPELIEDYREYALILSAAGCREYREPGTRGNSYGLFENSAIETDAVLSRISSLLQGGTPAGGIVITAADEQVSTLLLSKARLRGLPVNSRQGRPLSDYPAGRLPELIRECRRSGFSISAMKGLLVFRAFRWKDARLASSLIRFGIENRCLKNTASSVYGDVWASRLKAAGERELLSFYRKLRARIEAFTNCGSFGELAGELQIFISSFLDTDSELWDEGCEQVFQRTREILSSLKETEAGLTDIEIVDPLGLWIEILQEKIYVQQQSGPGVALYPYRVSAGMKPEHHFILGLSHDSCSITSKSFAFLTDQQRKEVNADELNMTEDFLNIYSVSGNEVWFSGASETPAGVALPPGRFIEDSAINRITTEQRDYHTDPFYLENLWWERMTGKGPEPEAGPELSAVQKNGYLHALETFMDRTEFDITGAPLPGGELLETLIPIISDENGLLRVSASALNRWSDCPFRYLMEDVLKIREDEYILQPEDPMTAGTIMHEILFKVFDVLKEEGRPFSGAEASRFRQLIEDESAEVFLRWEKEENYFYGPAWDALKRRTLKSLLLLPEAEAEFFDGFKPAYLEAWLDTVFAEEGIKAGGYIDRISIGADDGAERSVVVDYKKNWSKVTKPKFIQFDENGSLMRPEAGYQLPFYLILAAAEGLANVSSSYYSITSGKHYPVSGEFGILDDDEVEKLVELTISETKRMAESVRLGNFRTPDRCTGCALRAVCRKRFNIRWTE